MEDRENVNEQWKVGEFKTTVVEIYNLYMSTFGKWCDGVQGLTADRKKTRSDFITAMTMFYSDQSAAFSLYLDKKTTDIKPEWYKQLLFKDEFFTNERLLSMHFHLINWFSTYGAKSLANEVTVFNNPIEGALAEFFQTTSKTKGTAKYSDIQPIYNFMQTMLNHPDNGLKKTNQDCFFVVTGKTGSGKSYLLLDLFEYWYKNILEVKDFDKEYIKYFATTNEQHNEGLAELVEKKWSMLCHDEVGRAIKRRNHMTKNNRNFAEIYDVIRGLNLIHGQAIPDFSEMEKGFLKQRIDFLIVIATSGNKRYARFYSRQRLRDLHDDVTSKNIGAEESKVPPNFSCVIPLYTGLLLKPYSARKQEGMRDVVSKVAELDGNSAKREKGKQLYELIEKKGKGYVEAYKGLELDHKTGKAYLIAYCNANKLKLPAKKQKR